MLVAESSGQGTNLKSLRSLRGLRTFRPLRMISRRPGLKLVVNALFEAIPEVMNILFLCMLFFLIFSIVAVNYLKGTFSACSGDVFEALSADQVELLVSPISWNLLTDTQQAWFDGTGCEGFPTTTLTSEYLCGCWQAEWGPVLAQNFNNVGAAMLTLFEISTTEGWADVMMAAIDATDIGMQPVRDNNMFWAFFFVLFIMVGSFFVVNLFVGVIIDNFNRMKAALGGDFMKPPRQPLRRALFTVVRMQRFEWLIMICIIVNTFLMAAQFFGESTLQAYVINIINEVFAVVFTLEAALKLTAFGWEYFEEQWNQFDFFVVLGTLLSVVVELFTGASVRSLAMLVRVFRVTRILRLVKASKSIRQILLTLYIALPGLSNITSILFLMLFIYSTMGVQIFAKVALSDNIDSHANFQDFGTGFLFLLRAATGEAWNSCMHDLATASPGCVDDPPYDPRMCGFNNVEGCTPINGCGNPIAYAFFCSFTLLVTYVMLNLTIAVILEGFSLSHEEEEPLFDPELLAEFQAKWSEIDPKATGFVKVDKMLLLINIHTPPLGRFGMPLDMSHFFKYMCTWPARSRLESLSLTCLLVRGRPTGDPPVRGRVRPLPRRASRHDEGDGQGGKCEPATHIHTGGGAHRVFLSVWPAHGRRRHHHRHARRPGLRSRRHGGQAPPRVLRARVLRRPPHPAPSGRVAAHQAPAGEEVHGGVQEQDQEAQRAAQEAARRARLHHRLETHPPFRICPRIQRFPPAPCRLPSIGSAPASLAPLGLLPEGPVHMDGAAQDLLAVQPLHGSLGVLEVLELHQRVALDEAGAPVQVHVQVLDLRVLPEGVHHVFLLCLFVHARHEQDPAFHGAQGG